MTFNLVYAKCFQMFSFVLKERLSPGPEITFKYNQSHKVICKTFNICAHLQRNVIFEQIRYLFSR